MVIRKVCGESSAYFHNLSSISFHPDGLWSGTNISTPDESWTKGQSEMLNLFKTIEEDSTLEDLTKNSIPLTVIEKEEQARQKLEQNKILYIDRDATHEDALIDAGVKRAKGVVSVVSSDPENVYITLSARGLNRELFILSRAEYSATKAKLLQAGANKVILPYDIGARRMAQAIIRPAVSDFIELAMHESSFELAIEEIVVGKDSPFVNLTLIESEIRKELDIIVIGIKKKDGGTIFNPSSQTMIQPGDLLIAMGSYENLERLRKLLIADS